MQVSYENQLQSVPKYLQFVFLRLEHGHPIVDDEIRDTYKYYVQFCKDSKIDWLGRTRFYRELKQRGIETKPMWDRDMKKTVLVRDLNDKDTLKMALEQWVDNSAVVGTVMEINGERYQVVIKLIKINSKENL